jgi:hypothetical protein
VRRMDRMFTCLATLAAMCSAAASGCTHAPPPQQVKAKPKAPDAWISARSFCVLPLSKDEVPRTGGQLATSVVTALKQGLKLKDPAQAVTIVGGRYPAVDTMRVDLSNATMIVGKRGAGIAEPTPASHGLVVNHFSLLAEPMVTYKGKNNLLVTAEDVRFALQHDKANKPVLVMTDARAGTLHFDTATADLQRVALAIAKESAGKYAVTVRSVDLKLTSAGPRSINVDLHLSTLFTFIPAGLRFTARVDVDDAMNAKVSNLQAQGDEILGPLITQFIRPSLAKFDGKTKPLVSFPNPAVKLKDVRIDAGERVTLDATFGR